MANNILRHIPGEKRYYAVEFAAQQEMIEGETLVGTPTVAFDDASNLTVAADVNGLQPGLGSISGTQVRFWITTQTTASIGDRLASVTVSSSGGAIIVEKCTLRIVSQ